MSPSDDTTANTSGDDPSTTEHIQYHRDGSIWARGPMVDGIAEGYWEWFRKDGTRMRSGTFTNGEQDGDWTTYDKSGDPYKVTRITPK